jgi:hypothetical protein
VIQEIVDHVVGKEIGSQIALRVAVNQQNGLTQIDKSRRDVNG